MSEIDGKAKYTGIKQRIHQQRKYGEKNCKFNAVMNQS